MNLSLAITSFNRFEMTVESFAQVIDDPRIDDVVILDDCSTDNSYQKLVAHFKGDDNVRVIRQAQNRGMSRNKHDAIALAKNDWAIILDSDNIIGTNYIDALEYLTLDEQTIYCPVFARPQFDFRKFGGLTFGQYNIANRMTDDMFNVAMNCCNYLVNRNRYIGAYDHNPEHKCSDTIWFNYNWLKRGGLFEFVHGMEYTHRVHPGSGFLQDADYNMKKSAEVRKLIMQL
jgi:glycosyltransferase involved in cell wall biosynthesis